MPIDINSTAFRIRLVLAFIVLVIFLLFYVRAKWREYGGNRDVFNAWIYGWMPFIGKKYRRRLLRNQEKLAEAGTVYNSEKDEDAETARKMFYKFQRDLPVYCISEGLIQGFIRGIYESAGAEFLQILLYNKAGRHNKYVYARREGDTLVHDKGTYFLPWENVNDLLPWDIVDSRPLIDKTNDWDWKNPEAFAEAVTGLVNTHSMQMQSGQLEQIRKMAQYAMYAAILAAGLIAFLLYQENNANVQTIALLQEIAGKLK